MTSESNTNAFQEAFEACVLELSDWPPPVERFRTLMLELHGRWRSVPAEAREELEPLRQRVCQQYDQ